MKKNFLLNLLICSLLAFSCKEKNLNEPDANGNKEIRSDTQLIVEKYILPAGETAEFPSGFEIVANQGVEIAGTIIIKPDRPGNFTIRCTGDGIISGKVIVQNDTAKTINKKIIAGSNIMGKKTEAAKGIDIAFVFNGYTYTILSGAEIIAGNGIDADGTKINSWDGVFLAEDGGDGGNINILAGRIILPKLQPGAPPIFTLGNGGSGSNIIVDRNEFSTTGTSINLTAGHGGTSGHLYFDADTVEGIPVADELNPESEYLAGGVGGKGGNVIWENTEEPILPGSSGTLDLFGDDNRLPSLEEIIFQGGWGGPGAIEGGKGGFAAYWSGRVIHYNVPNKKAPSVSVTGGNGGDVFSSPLPVYLALGGEGGEYIVFGNYGQPGVCVDTEDPEGCFPDGAQGGDVEGKGGNGGSVFEDVMFYNAIGGDGGNSEVARARLVNELLVRGDPSVSIFESALYGVTAGAGGWGADRNDGCPGGDGGNSGALTAIGGDGGNVPNRPNAKGGQGGDVWARAVFKRSIFDDLNIWMGAGDGNPPGEKGCRSSGITSVGSGGQGNIPGDDGDYFGISIGSEFCGEDGEPAGEELTCEGDTTKCWEEIGSSFTAYSYESSRTTTKDPSSYELIRSGSITSEGHLLSFDQTINKYIWEVRNTSWEFLSENGRVIKDTTWLVTNIFEVSKCDNILFCNPVPNTGPAGSPRCLGGRLYFPGTRFTHAYHVENENDPLVMDVEIVFEYSGCHAYGNISDWVCCDNGGDGLIRNIRRDGDCP